MFSWGLWIVFYMLALILFAWVMLPLWNRILKAFNLPEINYDVSIAIATLISFAGFLFNIWKLMKL
jgi:hypothetical protein